MHDEANGKLTEVSQVETLDEPSEEMLTPGRDRLGRFAPGNLAAFVHGARSRQVQQAALPEQAEVVAALAERRQAIENDLGGVEHLSTLNRDVVTRYLEVSVVADYLGGRLMREGPLTTKGRQRAALSAYLGALDRQVKLASMLGLSRRVRSVSDLSIEQYVALQKGPTTDDRLE